jgi:glycosyltransferase involved in cell wall biosynthesis
MFDARVRARHFWWEHRTRWCQAVREELETADVVHSGLDDLFRPIMGLAHQMAVARGVPTVFVQDTDVVLQIPELAGESRIRRWRAAMYVYAYERVCRRMVSRADLVLMKGGSLTRRYAAYAPHLKEFEDTSYFTSDIVPDAAIEARLGTLSEDRPLKLVYCGRLVRRKGLHVSLQVLAAARAAGGRFEFDIIGSGPEEAALRVDVERLGLADVVRFQGSMSYGAPLLRRLAQADAMLFTPTAEDTPRMIFDGYAAGLPLLGADIQYVRHRAERDGATALLPRDDPERAARLLVGIDRDRRALAELTGRAQVAARYHSADEWYARRAAWTHEAVMRCRTSGVGERARR